MDTALEPLQTPSSAGISAPVVRRHSTRAALASLVPIIQPGLGWADSKAAVDNLA